MKKFGAFAALLVVALLPQIAPASAAAPPGATMAAFVSQTGSMGMTVSGDNTTATAVNTADDGQFVQMDWGSSITMAFPTGVNANPNGTAAADLVIDTYDTVWPACAFVDGSLDGTTWFSLAPAAPTHDGCPTDPASSVGIDSNGNYANTAQPLGSNVVTGFADTSNVNLDLDLVPQAAQGVHFIRVTQAQFIADPYPGFGFDLDSVYALNTTPLPPPPPPVTEGCVFSHGYYKNHPALVTALTLGGTPYTKAQVQTILSSTGGGKVAVQRHLIALLLSPGPHGPLYASLVSQANAMLHAGTGDFSALALQMSNYIDTYHC